MLRRIAPQQDAIGSSPCASGWSVQQLPADCGACRTDRYADGRGLALALTRYAPAHDLVEESRRTGHARTLTITVGLRGDSAYAGAGGGALAFRPGYTTVSASRDTVGERRFSAHSPVAQLRIAVDAAELAHHVGPARAQALLGDQALQQIACHPTTGAALAHAQALARLARAAAPDALALHLHMLGLLHAETQRIAPAPAERAQRLTPAEAARIERAHGLMQAWIGQPLSVAALAAEVGISAFKLRQGFQALYGGSPQQVLLDLRMRQALALLESGLQVATVAYRVGYGHPSNFSAAFSRYHGRAPKSVPTLAVRRPD